MSAARQPVACAGNRFEPRFRALASILFRSSLLLTGTVLDTGAFTGEEACFYSDLDRNRTVHALEPLHANFKIAHRYQAGRPNLKLHHGALGSVTKTISMRSAQVSTSRRSHLSMLQNSELQHGVEGDSKLSTGSQESTTIHVHRLDDFFQSTWAGEQLAFAHIDVEGAELDVLWGASAIIQRDRPLFSVEVWVHKNHSYTHQLVDHVKAAGYRPYSINERCGLNGDCRNLLCLPLERDRNGLGLMELVGDDKKSWVTAVTGDSLIQAVPR